MNYQIDAEDILYRTEDNEETTIDPAITEAWKAARLGKFTSSTIAKLNVKGTAKDEVFGDAAITSIYKKAGEILTLEANELSSPAIQWGNEHEPFANKEFQRIAKKEVTYYGKENPIFLEYGLHAGGSPDGWIEKERATVEYKSPFESGNHAKVFHQIKAGKFNLNKHNKEYYGQVQFNMFLQKAAYGYFVSFDPRVVDPAFAICYAKIEVDEPYIKNLLERLGLAIDVKIDYLTTMGYYASPFNQAKEAA